MEVVKVNQADKVLMTELQSGVCFEYGGCVYMRIHAIKTAVIGDEVLENVLAVNLEDGRYFYLDKDSESEVSVVPLHTAKIVVE